MKATISNNTRSPKGFYVGADVVIIDPNQSVDGDYEDGLLISLKKTGFDVKHEGKLSVGEKASSGDGASKEAIESAKADAVKIIDDAKAEAGKLIEVAKVEAEKLIAEAKELADSMLEETSKPSKK